MRVLVSGAGIAGCTLAFWLSKAGHNVTVIERFPQLRASGLQLDLRGHGVEVMKRMGLETAFRAKVAPEQGVEIVGSSGMRWAYFPANKSGKGVQSFTTEFEVMRSDMCRILHDATKDRVKYVFGNSIKSWNDREISVEVGFEDGSTDHFDLVVGADGQSSRTRRMMLGTGNPDGFRPIGNSHIAYVSLPRPMEKDEGFNATMYVTTGGRGIMTRRHSPEWTQAYIGGNLSSDRMKGVYGQGVKGEKEALAEVFKGAGWKSDEIIEAMMEDNDFYLAQIGIVKLDRWHEGRIALVGDAAYCPSPNGGMGTSSAMVGAYIMAGEITRHIQKEDTKKSIEEGLDAYESKFRPFMDQVQKGVDSGEATLDKLPKSALGITLMNAACGLASLLKIDITSKFVVREIIKDWDLPDYSEVFRA